MTSHDLTRKEQATLPQRAANHKPADLSDDQPHSHRFLFHKMTVIESVKSAVGLAETQGMVFRSIGVPSGGRNAWF